MEVGVGLQNINEIIESSVVGKRIGHWLGNPL